MDNGALRGTENLGPEQLAERLRSVIAQGRDALQAEHGYARSDPVTGAAIADEDQFTLDKLLVERLYAKRSRDFAKADEIRARINENVIDGTQSALLNKMVDVVGHTLRTNLFLENR